MAPVNPNAPSTHSHSSSVPESSGSLPPESGAGAQEAAMASQALGLADSLSGLGGGDGGFGELFGQLTETQKALQQMALQNTATLVKADLSRAQGGAQASHSEGRKSDNKQAEESKNKNEALQDRGQDRHENLQRLISGDSGTKNKHDLRQAHEKQVLDKSGTEKNPQSGTKESSGRASQTSTPVRSTFSQKLKPQVEQHPSLRQFRDQATDTLVQRHQLQGPAHAPERATLRTLLFKQQQLALLKQRQSEMSGADAEKLQLAQDAALLEKEIAGLQEQLSPEILADLPEVKIEEKDSDEILQEAQAGQDDAASGAETRDGVRRAHSGENQGQSDQQNSKPQEGLSEGARSMVAARVSLSQVYQRRNVGTISTGGGRAESKAQVESRMAYGILAQLEDGVVMYMSEDGQAGFARVAERRGQRGHSLDPVAVPSEGHGEEEPVLGQANVEQGGTLMLQTQKGRIYTVQQLERQANEYLADHPGADHVVIGGESIPIGQIQGSVQLAGIRRHCYAMAVTSGRHRSPGEYHAKMMC